jgi:hypothetical protein
MESNFSNTRPCDAPEFILSFRYRNPTLGPRFTRLFYTGSTVLFGSYRVLYDSSILRCYCRTWSQGLAFGEFRIRDE